VSRSAETSYVEADIAKGRLVVPFKITLPADAGFYLVSPLARADSPKLSAFRAMADRLHPGQPGDELNPAQPTAIFMLRHDRSARMWLPARVFRLVMPP